MEHSGGRTKELEMYCIDLDGGDGYGRTIILVGGQNALEAAEIAKREHGRLRLLISLGSSTSDAMSGCIELGDWRRP